MSVNKNEIVLICDIGGTNVRFGLYHENQEDLVSFDGKYKCADFSSFEEVVGKYFSEHQPNKKPSLCVVGAAGDINETTGKIVATNTPWVADTDKLKKAFPFIKKAQLVNDFALQGWALSDMTPEQYRPVFGSKENVNLKEGKIVVIGPGTGLGSCLIMPGRNGEQNVYTSEAGHSTIPLVTFADKEEQKLNQRVVDTIIDHYGQKGQRAVTEHLISGTGITNIYHAIRDGKIPFQKEERVSSEKIETLAQQGDKTALKTFDIFNAYMGAHAGTMLATTKAPTVFFCGGVMASPWISKRMEETPYFKDQLIPRSGLTKAMEQVQLYTSSYRDMSTLGAVVYAKNMIKNQKNEDRNRSVDRDILRVLCYVQQLINTDCPDAKQPMKKVISAVKRIQHNRSNTRE